MIGVRVNSTVGDRGSSHRIVAEDNKSDDKCLFVERNYKIKLIILRIGKNCEYLNRCTSYV